MTKGAEQILYEGENNDRIQDEEAPLHLQTLDEILQARNLQPVYMKSIEEQAWKDNVHILSRTQNIKNLVGEQYRRQGLMRPRALMKGTVALNKRKPEKSVSTSHLIEDTTKQDGENDASEGKTPELISSYSSQEEQETRQEPADFGTLARLQQDLEADRTRFRQKYDGLDRETKRIIQLLRIPKRNTSEQKELSRFISKFDYI
jgi:hypothetical protein